MEVPGRFIFAGHVLRSFQELGARNGDSAALPDFSISSAAPFLLSLDSCYLFSLIFFKKRRIGEAFSRVQICCSSRFPSETLPSSRKDFITFQNRRAGSFLQAATSEVKDEPWLPA